MTHRKDTRPTRYWIRRDPDHPDKPWAVVDDVHHPGAAQTWDKCAVVQRFRSLHEATQLGFTLEKSWQRHPPQRPSRRRRDRKKRT